MTTLLQAALDYAELGFPVFPCDPKTKVPLTQHGFKQATVDRQIIEGWWSQSHPNAAIGIPMGKVSGVFACDLDCKPGQPNGVAEWPKLVAQHQTGKLTTLMSRTPSGGLHYFFQWVEGVRNIPLHKLWAGVEVKGEGGYVIVAPSAGYKWLNEKEEEIKAAPEWLLGLIRTKSRKPAKAVAEAAEDVDRGMIEAALDVTPSDEYQVWFEVGSALHSLFGDDGFKLFEAWSKKSAKFKVRESRRKWNDCSKVGGYSVGTIYHHATAALPGWDEAYYARVIAANARDDAPEWLDDKDDKPAAKKKKKKDDDPPVVIIIRDGDLLGILDKAETALLAGGVPIYQRGGELVMPDKRIRDDSIKRDADVTTLFHISPEWLVQMMSQTAAWAKPAKKGMKAADPPTKYANALLARPPSSWKFPKLLGIISAPTLDRDGGIIEEPGYHPGTELLLDFKAGEFPPVPKRPSKKDAMLALEKLNHPLRGFPFDEESEDNNTSSSRSVALSAMLTALIRTALRTAPLHGFDAPVAGTGKSLLAEAPALLVAGCRPASMSQGKSAEEDEKRLSVALHAADQVIMLDNCQHQVSGDFLCSMLTQQKVQARILGLSERRVLPCTCLIVCNGNNLTFAGDVSRRAVKCGLDAHTERPDQRVFDFDFSEEMLRDRAVLVVAGLTILRAYVVAGRPLQAALVPMGSFADWAWVRGALVWLGHPDPALTRDRIMEADPRRADLAGVLESWFRAYGILPVTLAEIGQMNGHDGDKSALRTLLTELSGKSLWNAKSVGWWLRRNARRIVEGRCFMPADGAKKWQIVETNEKVSADLRGEERPSLEPF